MKNGFEITHVTYGDACGDPWYGKERRSYSIGFVYAEESEVKQLVDELNKANNSYYAKDEPEDEYDDDYCDEDYFIYEKVRFIEPEDFRKVCTLLKKEA